VFRKNERGIGGRKGDASLEKNKEGELLVELWVGCEKRQPEGIVLKEPMPRGKRGRVERRCQRT